MSAPQVTKRGTDGPVSKRRSGSVPFLVGFYRSAVGKKYVMAITGLILMGYVFAHMVGNLKLYGDAAHFDTYAQFLRAFGEPIVPYEGFLWTMRVILLLAVGFHIHSSYALTMMNRRARRTRYESKRDFIAADFAARSMRWTGIIVALFIVYHVADLTLGWGGADFTYGEVHNNVVQSFSRPVVALFYVLGNIALGIHLYHGAWSLFQTLGINNRRFNHWRRYFAIGFALIITIPNVSFPIAVQLGVITEAEAPAEDADDALAPTPAPVD
jgi:succinate dehydrogenase / fumarate reductase, cytochrome b subunit